jgi:hypothetical protein
MIVICLFDFIIFLLVISTPASTQGVVGCLQGSAMSNVTIYNTVFEADGTGAGITGSSTDVTMGGVVYVGTVNTVEVVNSTFEQISLVGLGGGLFVTNALLVDVRNTSFKQIVVSTSGGYLFFFYLLWCLLCGLQCISY